MARYHVDKDGKKTLVQPSTKPHPEGDRPRLADGTHPTEPASKPAKPLTPPAKATSKAKE